MSSPGNQGAQVDYDSDKYFAQDFYIYQVSFGAFATNAQVVVNLQIQSDSDFEWIETTCYGNMTGATPPFSDVILLPISIAMVDSGSSRQLFSGGVPLTSMAGTGKQPFILPVSRLIKSYSNIQITGTSFDGTNAYANVAMSLIGRKLFLRGGQ